MLIKNEQKNEHTQSRRQRRISQVHSFEKKIANLSRHISKRKKEDSHYKTMLLPSSDKTTYCQCHITTQTEQRHQSKNDVTRDLVTPELIQILKGQPIKINHTVSDSELYVCSFTHSILFLKIILTFCEKKNIVTKKNLFEQ